MAVRGIAFCSDRACCSAAACRQRLSRRPKPISRRGIRSCSPTRPTRRRASRSLSAPHRRLSPQRSAGLDRGRYRCALSLLRAAGQEGDPLRRDRRRRRAVLLRHRQGRPQGRMAGLDADRRHQEAARNVPNFVEGGPAQSVGRARHLPVPGQQGHAVPHPRHQPAGIYRAGDLVGLHPHDQRGRDRPLQSREDGLDRGGAGAEAGRLAVQSAGRNAVELTRIN